MLYIEQMSMILWQIRSDYDWFEFANRNIPCPNFNQFQGLIQMFLFIDFSLWAAFTVCFKSFVGCQYKWNGPHAASDNQFAYMFYPVWCVQAQKSCCRGVLSIVILNTHHAVQFCWIVCYILLELLWKIVIMWFM